MCDKKSDRERGLFATRDPALKEQKLHTLEQLFLQPFG
jgi:hypothetical protein